MSTTSTTTRTTHTTSDAPAPPTAAQQQYAQQLVAVLPQQGEWTPEAYLWLSEHTSTLVEYNRGYLEFPPMPTDEHQTVLATLYRLLFTFVQVYLPQGVVLFAPLRLYVAPDRYREPDLLLLCDKDDPARGNRAWQRADLVAEVLSPDNAAHDTVTKRAEYAAAGFPEYWLVDPQAQHITVLTLPEGGDRYTAHGTFAAGATLTSPLLPALALDVAAVFAD